MIHSGESSLNARREPLSQSTVRGGTPKAYPPRGLPPVLPRRILPLRVLTQVQQLDLMIRQRRTSHAIRSDRCSLLPVCPGHASCLFPQAPRRAAPAHTSSCQSAPFTTLRHAVVRFRPTSGVHLRAGARPPTPQGTDPR